MTTSSCLDLLESIPCFSGLEPGAMEWLLGSVEEQSFAKDQVIILEGEPCPGLFVVRSGSVKLYRVSPEGEEQIVRILRRGGCFECAPLFDRGPNPVSAQAMEETNLYRIPVADFQSVLGSYPEAVLGFTYILAMRLRSLLNMVEDFSFRRVSSRLAKLLIQLSEGDGEILVVSPSQLLNQQHLACMLGCSRQMVNNSLRKLVKAGAIKMEGRRILIMDLQVLREMAQP